MTVAVQFKRFPTKVIDFLKSITKEKSAIPQNYLFPFELSRLEFNRFGCIRYILFTIMRLIGLEI